MTQRFSPITVSVSRGILESSHLVDCAVVSPDGLQMAFGSVDHNVIARSSIKPIQVIPLVSTGAADALGFTDQDIALGSASHSGESEHLDRVRSMLDKIGLDETALECGASRCIGENAADEVIRSGAEFERIHNCCSGKHAGFLAIAQHLGIDHAGYIQPTHRVQALVSGAVSTFTGVDLSTQSPGMDGCGIPTFGIPLQSLALAMARLANPESIGEIGNELEEVCSRVITSLSPNPFWMSGTGRAEIDLSDRATETLVSKSGAEGVFMASLPARNVGIALKVRDGGQRAATAAIEAVLELLEAVAQRPTGTTVTNAEATVVGTMDVNWS